MGREGMPGIYIKWNGTQGSSAANPPEPATARHALLEALRQNRLCLQSGSRAVLREGIRPGTFRAGSCGQESSSILLDMECGATLVHGVIDDQGECEITSRRFSHMALISTRSTTAGPAPDWLRPVAKCGETSILLGKYV